MEKLQLFDNNKNILDEYIERDKKEELPENKKIMVVLIFIQNKEGKFLIQKTSKEKGNIYATTGGHVTYKDDNITTVLKECYEELGISLSKEDLILVDSTKEDCCFIETFYCKKNINISECKLQAKEVESISWKSDNEIKELIAQDKFRKGNIEFFNKILNFLNK